MIRLKIKQLSYYSNTHNTFLFRFHLHLITKTTRPGCLRDLLNQNPKPTHQPSLKIDLSAVKHDSAEPFKLFKNERLMHEIWRSLKSTRKTNKFNLFNSRCTYSFCRKFFQRKPTSLKKPCKNYVKSLPYKFYIYNLMSASIDRQFHLSINTINKIAFNLNNILFEDRF